MITTSPMAEIAQSGTMDMSGARVLGVNAEGAAAIVQILTNQYSNPALAAVREYSCNARDSHVEAGKRDVPIEVTLPTHLDPQLRIQDYGLGLSRDGILNTFAEYCSSTKRNSNDYIGAMGIGSKAGFTVGNQFIVTGVKDGMKTVALFALNRHGEPTVDIMFEGVTDEPNGVLVDIGVENVEAIRKAATELFYTWDQGSVLVDGQRPEHVWFKANSLGDDGYMVTVDQNLGWGASPVIVVMGGVSYKLTRATMETLPMNQRGWLSSFGNSKARFYVNVPIGAVDITPSREDLRVTRHTTETVTDVVAKLMINVPKWITEELNSAPTFTDAAMRLRKIKDAMNWLKYEEVSWKGKPFNRRTVRLERPSFRHYKPSRGYIVKTKLSPFTQIDLSNDLTKYLVITGVPDDKIATVRRYIKPILFEDRMLNSETAPVVIVSPLTNESVEWFAYGKGMPIETMSFEDWRELGRKLIKSNTSVPVERNTPSYEVAGMTDNMTAQEIIDLDMPVAFYEYQVDPLTGVLANAALTDHAVVYFSKGQRAATFMKRVPGSLPAGDVVRAYAKDLLANLSDADKILVNDNAYLANTDSYRVGFLIQNKDKITNQGVLDYIEFHEKTLASVKGDPQRLQEIQRAASFLCQDLPTQDTDLVSFVDTQLPFVSLYIVQRWSAQNIAAQATWEDHLVKYINSTDISITI